MITKEYKILIDRLLSSTLKKGIKWEETSLDFKYKAKVGLGTVTIEKSILKKMDNSVITLSYLFSILNDEGKQIGSAFEANSNSGNPNYDILEKLYIAASESSLNINKTIQSMLDELDQLDAKNN